MLNVFSRFLEDFTTETGTLNGQITVFRIMWGNIFPDFIFLHGQYWRLILGVSTLQVHVLPRTPSPALLLLVLRVAARSLVVLLVPVLFHDIINLQERQKQWAPGSHTCAHCCHHCGDTPPLLPCPFPACLSVCSVVAVCPSWLSVAGITHWRKQLRGQKGFASSYSLQSLIKGNRVRNWRRDHGGTPLTGLLLMAYLVFFLIHPGAQGSNCPQWTGPHHINH